MNHSTRAVAWHDTTQYLRFVTTFSLICATLGVALRLRLTENCSHLVTLDQSADWSFRSRDSQGNYRCKLKTPSLCFTSLSGSFPKYLSDLWHVYTPARSLRSLETRRINIPKAKKNVVWSTVHLLLSPSTWKMLPETMAVSRFSICIFRLQEKHCFCANVRSNCIFVIYYVLRFINIVFSPLFCTRIHCIVLLLSWAITEFLLCILCNYCTALLSFSQAHTRTHYDILRFYFSHNVLGIFGLFSPWGNRNFTT